MGYEEGTDAPPGQSNRRNGTAGRRLKGQDGEVPISVPRDRDGRFEPELISKGQTRIEGDGGEVTEWRSKALPRYPLPGSASGACMRGGDRPARRKP